MTSDGGHSKPKPQPNAVPDAVINEKNWVQKMIKQSETNVAHAIKHNYYDHYPPVMEQLKMQLTMWKQMAVWFGGVESQSEHLQKNKKTNKKKAGRKELLSWLEEMQTQSKTNLEQARNLAAKSHSETTSWENILRLHNQITTGWNELAIHQKKQKKQTSPREFRPVLEWKGPHVTQREADQKVFFGSGPVPMRAQEEAEARLRSHGDIPPRFKLRG
eukprot:618455-Rhodomonas_salina.1